MFIKIKTSNNFNKLININHIVDIHEINENKISLRLTNNEIAEVDMSLKEIKRLVNNEITIQIDK